VSRMVSRETPAEMPSVAGLPESYARWRSGRLVVGELGRWSLWAAIRRVRGWLGASTWRAARFRTAGDLQRLLERRGLAVRETRGSVYYPPCGLGASLMAPFDPWLGRRMTLGAAFIALSAAKPIPRTDTGSR